LQSGYEAAQSGLPDTVIFRLMTKLLAIASTVALALATAGCGSDGAQEAGPLPTAPAASEPIPTETAPPATTATETTGTSTSEPEPPAAVHCDSVTGGDEGVYTNLVDVRVGAHPDFDRVVFEFAPPSPNPGGKAGIPHYDIEAVRPPFSEDPSDLPIEVEGAAFARIVLQGATGYDFYGNATYDGPRRLTPGYETLTQLVEGGDFEATMTWIFGLSQRSCWQVHELHNPDRLVIDFIHVDV
jgi:hypothetical protein